MDIKKHLSGHAKTTSSTSVRYNPSSSSPVERVGYLISDSRYFKGACDRIESDFKDSRVCLIESLTDVLFVLDLLKARADSSEKVVLVVNSSRMSSKDFSRLLFLYSQAPQYRDVVFGEHVKVCTVVTKSNLVDNPLQIPFGSVGGLVDLTQLDSGRDYPFVRSCMYEGFDIDSEAYVLDLEFSSDWKSEFLIKGRLLSLFSGVPGFGFTSTGGKREIVLRNVPDDAKQYILDWFEDMRQFGLYDKKGARIDISTTSLVFFDGLTSSEIQMVQQQVKVVSEPKDSVGKPVFRVNLGNVSQVVSDTDIHSDGSYVSTDGFLGLMPDGGCLRLEETIPERYLLVILNKVALLNNSRKLENSVHLILNEGVLLPPKFGIPQEFLSDRSSCVSRMKVDDLYWYHYNNPSTNNRVVLHVHPDTRISDYVGALELKDLSSKKLACKDSSELLIIQQLRELCRRRADGEEVSLVVLNGGSNPDFMRWLSSLKEDPPYVLVHSKRVELSDQPVAGLPVVCVDEQDVPDPCGIMSQAVFSSGSITPAQAKVKQVFNDHDIPLRYVDQVMDILKSHVPTVGFKYFYLLKLAIQIKIEQRFDHSSEIRDYHVFKALNVLAKYYRVEGNPERNKRYLAFKADVAKCFGFPHALNKTPLDKQLDYMLSACVHKNVKEDYQNALYPLLLQARRQIIKSFQGNSRRFNSQVCRMFLQPLEVALGDQATVLDHLSRDIETLLRGEGEIVAERARVIVKECRAESLDGQLATLYWGATGIGKSELGKQLCRRLGLALYRINIGPDTTNGDFLGRMELDPETRNFTTFKPGMVTSCLKDPLGRFMGDESSMKPGNGVMREIAGGQVYVNGDCLPVVDRTGFMWNGNQSLGGQYGGRYPDPFLEEVAVVKTMKDITGPEMVVKVIESGLSRIAELLGEAGLVCSDEELNFLIRFVDGICRVIHTEVGVPRSVFGAREIVACMAELHFRLILEKESAFRVHDSHDLSGQHLFDLVYKVVVIDGLDKLTRAQSDLVIEGVRASFKSFLEADSGVVLVDLDREVNPCLAAGSYKPVAVQLAKKRALLDKGIAGVKQGMAIVDDSEQVVTVFKETFSEGNPLEVSYSTKYDFSKVKAQINKAYEEGRPIIVRCGIRLPQSVLEEWTNLKFTEYKKGFVCCFAGSSLASLSPASRSRMDVIGNTVMTKLELEATVITKLDVSVVTTQEERIIEFHRLLEIVCFDRGVHCDLTLDMLLGVLGSYKAYEASKPPFGADLESFLRFHYGAYLVHLGLNVAELSSDEDTLSPLTATPRSFRAASNTSTISARSRADSRSSVPSRSTSRLQHLKEKAERDSLKSSLKETIREESESPGTHSSSRPSFFQRTMRRMSKPLVAITSKFKFSRGSKDRSFDYMASFTIDGDIQDGVLTADFGYEGPDRHNTAYDRWQVFNKISLHGGVVELVATVPELVSLADQPVLKPNLETYTLQAGEKFINFDPVYNEDGVCELPSVTPYDDFLFYDGNGSVKFVFSCDESNGRYFAQVSSKPFPKHLKLVVKSRASYYQEPIRNLDPNCQTWGWDQDYYKRLYGAQLPRLRSVLTSEFKRKGKDDLSIDEKLRISDTDTVVVRAQKIYYYFFGFSNVTRQESDVAEGSTLKLLMELMGEKFGVCRQRTFMAIVASLVYDVPCCFQVSQPHVFGMFKLPVAPGRNEWVRADFRDGDSIGDFLNEGSSSRRQSASTLSVSHVRSSPPVSVASSISLSSSSPTSDKDFKPRKPLPISVPECVRGPLSDVQIRSSQRCFCPDVVSLGIRLNDRTFESQLRKDQIGKTESWGEGQLVASRLDSDLPPFESSVVEVGAKRVVILSKKPFSPMVSRYLERMCGGYTIVEQTWLTKTDVEEMGVYPSDQYIVLDAADVTELSGPLLGSMPDFMVSLRNGRFAQFDWSVMDWSQSWLGWNSLECVMQAYLALTPRDRQRLSTFLLANSYFLKFLTFNASRSERMNCLRVLSEHLPDHEKVSLFTDSLVEVGLRAVDTPCLTTTIIEDESQLAQALAVGMNPDILEDETSPPLVVAAQNGDLWAMTMLIDAGADLELVDDSGMTALEWAIFDGHVDGVRLLLSRGASVVTQNSSLLSQCFRTNSGVDLAIVELLLMHGADVHQLSYEGLPLMSLAVQSEDIDLIRLLVRYGVSLHARGRNGKTPLHVAIDVNNEYMVRELIALGCSLDAVDYYGRSPLMIAVQSGNREFAVLLMMEGASTTLRDYKGRYILDYAVDAKNEVLVQELLSRGVVIEGADVRKSTVIHRAVRYKNQRILELLLDYSPPGYIDEADVLGNTALHIAVSEGSLHMLTLLLERQANPNKPDIKGNTPLHLSIRKSILTKALLDYDANADLKNGQGFTALFLAIKADKPEAVNNLMHRSDLTVTCVGYSCLSYAYSLKKPLVVASLNTVVDPMVLDGGGRPFLELLLMDRNKSFLNIVTGRGVHPIHWAFNCDKLEALDLFYRYGVKLDTLYLDRKSLARRAVEAKRERWIAYLLARNVDFTRSESGPSPLDIAKTFKDKRIYDLIRHYRSTTSAA